MSRKGNNHFILILLITISFLYLNTSLYPTQKSIAESLAITNGSKELYTLHDPIIINNDTELATIANSGNGSINNPYIITGWNITESVTSGIYITGTTKYFRIENCWIENSTSYGIFVKSVLKATTTIVNNTCVNNGKEGIYIDNSDSTSVINNTINNNFDNGIYFLNSEFSTVSSNTFVNDGLFIWESTTPEKKEAFLSYTVANNTVNGLPLGYFENKTDSILTGTYGQLILVNCNNTVIKNQNCSHTSIGIALNYCSENQIINNTYNNNWAGIDLFSSDSTTITNNTCNNNNWYGINLGYESESSTVTNNTCINNTDGIFIEAHNSTLNKNICNNNRFGVNSWLSDSSILVNNTCNNNIKSGVIIQSVDCSTLANNTCSSNKEYGIYLKYSDHNSIIKNILNDNGEYGIVLTDYCFSNEIHHNSFISNGQGESQAYDNGTNTQWYNQTLLEGNTWSDYSGVGSYLIAGFTGASDPYPSHTHSPSINQPANLTYMVGETGQTISWIATDPNNNPSAYTVYCNSSIFESDSWTSGIAINITVDGLEVGIYNFTMVVTDTDSFSVSTTVWVTIIPGNDTTSTTVTSNSTASSTTTSNSDTSPSPTTTSGFTMLILVFSFGLLLFSRRRILENY